MPHGSRAILFIMLLKKKKALAPCSDPERYILVKIREGT
jgi:hypothetical protein